MTDERDQGDFGGIKFPFPVRSVIWVGFLIQWSVKIERWMEDSTFGMWQVVQFLVFTGHAAPG